jgi:hypothetical protein
MGFLILEKIQYKRFVASETCLKIPSSTALIQGEKHCGQMNYFCPKSLLMKGSAWLLSFSKHMER